VSVCRDKMHKMHKVQYRHCYAPLLDTVQRFYIRIGYQAVVFWQSIVFLPISIPNTMVNGIWILRLMEDL